MTNLETSMTAFLRTFSLIFVELGNNAGSLR